MNYGNNSRFSKSVFDFFLKMDKKNVQKMKFQKSLGKLNLKIYKSQNIYWETYLKKLCYLS